MAIQKSSTKKALDLGNFESVVDEKLNSIFQRLTKNQTTKKITRFGQQEFLL